MSNHTHKEVFTIVPRSDGAVGPDGKKKGYFIKIGAAFVNGDGSMNLKLDALPVNGTMHIRDPLSDEERKRRFEQRSVQPVGFG